jgi:dimethylargininase
MTKFIALTREVSNAFDACELTHLPRTPIDVTRARAQHEAYEQALAGLGCRVERLTATDEMPDSVFIEDTAVVVDEVAIVTRPGAASRRVETTAVERALAAYRPVVHIEPPGTVDGGDVLVAGRWVFVGLSTRTNHEGVEQLRRHLEPFEYDVPAVAVSEALHLKSVVTAIADHTLLINPRWASRDCFPGFDLLEVDPAEPFAANALRVGDALVFPASFPRTRDRLVASGVPVSTVDVSELQKAEGAVTCCSILIKHNGHPDGDRSR